MANNEKLQSKIRHGLTQYVGALINNSDFSSKENKQLVVAALCEEALNIITSQNNEEIENDKFYIDDFAAKPFLRGMIFLITRNQERAREYMKGITNKKIQKSLEYYEKQSSEMEEFLKKWIESGGKENGNSSK